MKKKFYLTLDTETATLPFANEICKTAKDKQKIAIAKPLVYDIGWVITDRKGEVIKTANYLVQETFFVPNIFNTAYYKSKRNIYMELLNHGAIIPKCWNDIVAELLEDLRTVDLTTAYNACFDFKKAIPFTERYIENLYSSSYNDWEARQKKKCYDILRGRKPSENSEYLKPYFELRGERFPIADLWGISCDRLINIDKYRNYCLKNELLTASAIYFKTSAETCFQYLTNQYDFIEDHTALSDAEIEAKILTKALKKGKIEPTIESFPFKMLGETYRYAKAKQPKYIPTVARLLEEYLNTIDDSTAYAARIQNILMNL